MNKTLPIVRFINPQDLPPTTAHSPPHGIKAVAEVRRLGHALRSPITAALGYLDLARRALADGDADRVLDDLNCVESALHAATNLIKLAMESNHPMFVPLDVTTQDIAAVFRPSLESRGIRLCCQFMGNTTVFAPPTDICDILVNLIANAGDAIDEHASNNQHPRGTITVSVAQCPAGQAKPECVVLTVADTGPGMNAEQMRKAFSEQFTSKGQRGHGIGLLSILGAASNAKATIKAISNQGEGMTFEIRFPA